MCGGQRRAAVPLKRDGGTRERKAPNGSTKQSACRALPTQKSGVQLTVQILRILFRHLRPVSKSKFAAGSGHAGAGNRAIPFLWICFLYSTVFAVCKDKKGDSFFSCPRSLLKKVECEKLQVCAAVRKKSLCSFSWLFCAYAYFLEGDFVPFTPTSLLKKA